MSEESCYSLQPVLSADAADTGLDVAAVREWTVRARARGLRLAVPDLILKLDRLGKTALSASRRVDVLQVLKRPLLKMAAGLPKPVSKDHTGAAGSLMLEQRLYCLMAKNLKQALVDNDSSSEPYSAEMDKRRRWTMRNLFRFLGRQIEFGVLWDRPLPSNTWQELHDLYTYATVRGYSRSRTASPRSSRGADFDFQREYLRLLLMGLAARHLDRRKMSSVLLNDIASWAAKSRLVEPESHMGELGLYVVELSSDAPPRQVLGALTDTFRGWVLEPAEGFLDYVAALERGQSASRVYGGMRSASGMT